MIFPVATWKTSVTRNDIYLSIPRAFGTTKSPQKPKSNASFACMQCVLGFDRNEVTIQRLLSASIYITQVWENYYAVCTLATLSNMLIDYSTMVGVIHANGAQQCRRLPHTIRIRMHHLFYMIRLIESRSATLCYTVPATLTAKTQLSCECVE